MVTIKSSAEIAKMRVAAKVVAKVHKILRSRIASGVKLNQLNRWAAQIIREENCQPSFLGYQGFPGVICTSVNDVLIHGIPSGYRLKPGDLITIDAGVLHDGYHADAAFSMIIPPASKLASNLLLVTETALDKAIAVIKPGIRVGDIGAVISSYVKSKKMYLTELYTGHGIGQNLHEDPLIPNIGLAGNGMKLQKDMIICVEPMVSLETAATYVGQDGWAVVNAANKLTCHAEHELLITNNGAEILTV